MIDPTTLNSKAAVLLGLLEDSASDAGFTPSRSCVTNGPPSVECDSLFVWADAITPIKDLQGKGCHVVLRVRFQYVVAVCVGVVNCDQVMAATMHDTAWGTQAGLITAIMNNELCGQACNTVRFGDFTLLTNDGGYSWWQGSVQVDLEPEELTS